MTGSRTTHTLVMLTLAFGLAAAGGCTQQRSLLAVRESGEKAYKGGEYNKALAEFQEYVQRSPGSRLGPYNLGRTLLALNRPADAREQLEIAYTLDIENDDVFDALCATLFADKKNEELFQLLRQRTADHGKVKDYLRLAMYALRVGDADEAVRSLLTAAMVDKGQSLGPQLALADLYASVNDPALAIQRLRMAYYLEPGSEAVLQRIKEQGEIPGPTFAVRPMEMPPPPPPPGAPTPGDPSGGR